MPKSGDNRDNQNLPYWVLKTKSESQEVVAKARELLSQPCPDTFLGRNAPAPEPKE
jgi:hypothetical protein